MILGSEAFVAKIQEMVHEKSDDPGLPAARALAMRPAMARIVAAVASHLGEDPRAWECGRRCDGLGRALAAHVARRCYGYGATAIARSLGYSGPSGVSQAVRRVAESKGMSQHVENICAELAND